MLTIADFSRKIIFDLNKTFPIARVQGAYSGTFGRRIRNYPDTVPALSGQ